MDLESSELGLLVEEVAASPGQDSALHRGVLIIGIDGAPLLGLPEAQVSGLFGSGFRDGAKLLLVSADELREAMIERDSKEECPCEELANYELLHRAKSSTEYDAVVKIPVGRATVWSLSPEAMDSLRQDLTHVGERFQLNAEAKINRGGNVESIVLSGLSSAIALARPEVVQILQFYREGEWQGADPRADPSVRPELGTGTGAGDQPATEQIPVGLTDLRQFMYHDHTADIIVHAWGRTRAEAFAQVVVGMFNYMTEVEHVDVHCSIEVEAIGHDLLDLLYHLLDEFLFVFGTEMHISRHVEIVEFDEEALRIKARGYGEKMNLNKHEQGTEIKAITMHMMKILGPDSMMSEAGTGNRPQDDEESAKRVQQGFPHEAYVLLDI